MEHFSAVGIGRLNRAININGLNIQIKVDESVNCYNRSKNILL